MARFNRSRSGGGSRNIEVDPATRLHEQTVKLFDKGDGHGADWAAAAEALFRCGFAFLHNVPAGDPAAKQIARRVHEVAYGVIAGVEDSGAPYRATSGKPHRPAFTMTDPALDPDPSR